MIAFEGIYENLTFIILETVEQIESTREYIRNPDAHRYKQLIDRDSYVDNLKTTIENLCYEQLIQINTSLSKNETNLIRAIQIVGVNLERIADDCISIVKQTDHLDAIDVLYQFEYDEIFCRILGGIRHITSVLESRKLNDALAICKIEDEVDSYYKKNLTRILKRLESGESVRNLVTVLFIYRHLEKMGDSLLNIGEALIVGIVGEKMRISQIESLKRNLATMHEKKTNNLTDLEFRSFWGTRSGCRISRVKLNDDSEESPPVKSIFKEGVIQKIRAEKESLEIWHSLFPGLTPRVFSYQENGDAASLLLEFLDGITLDEMVLQLEQEKLAQIFPVLCNTCDHIWEATKKEQLLPLDYVSQLQRRLITVRSVHPEFVRFEQTLGDSYIASSESLIETCRRAESEMSAPFTVRIHGDYNVSNIMVNGESGTVHYIDLYRSRDADYIQDVSVFLVSNFRLPVFDASLRGNINWVIEQFYQFAVAFARKHHDRTFDFRMALALGRSLYTSTRFELNEKLSKEMFLRAHYLYDRVAKFVNSGAPPRDFKLPESVLYY